MPIITVTSPAAKCGKTLIAAHLAHGMALTGMKTLAIDLCQNGHLTETLSRSLCPGTSLLGDLREDMDLIPSFTALAECALERGLRHSTDARELVEHVGTDYDVVVIDTPSVIDALEWKLISNCSLTLIPLTSDPSTTYTLPNVLNKLAELSHTSKLQLISCFAQRSSNKLLDQLYRRITLIETQTAYSLHQEKRKLRTKLKWLPPLSYCSFAETMLSTLQTAFDIDFAVAASTLEQNDNSSPKMKELSETAFIAQKFSSSIMNLVERISEEMFVEALPIPEQSRPTTTLVRRA